MKFFINFLKNYKGIVITTLMTLAGVIAAASFVVALLIKDLDAALGSSEIPPQTIEYFDVEGLEKIKPLLERTP